MVQKKAGSEPQTVLTAQNRATLEAELDRLENEVRRDIAEQLRIARDFGDLSENAEYDAAKEAQSENENRINEIRMTLATAKVVEATSVEFGASVGTIVELADSNGKRLEFWLVGTSDTNSLKHKISNESPAGAALIGHVVGDTVSFVTPAGALREYTITNIRLPEKEG